MKRTAIKQLYTSIKFDTKKDDSASNWYYFEDFFFANKILTKHFRTKVSGRSYPQCQVGQWGGQSHFSEAAIPLTHLAEPDIGWPTSQ